MMRTIPVAHGRVFKILPKSVKGEGSGSEPWLAIIDNRNFFSNFRNIYSLMHLEHLDVFMPLRKGGVYCFAHIDLHAGFPQLVQSITGEYKLRTWYTDLYQYVIVDDPYCSTGLRSRSMSFILCCRRGHSFWTNTS